MEGEDWDYWRKIPGLGMMEIYYFFPVLELL
jgi:hypothetical protein